MSSEYLNIWPTLWNDAPTDLQPSHAGLGLQIH
jgi:hypothetical protein